MISGRSQSSAKLSGVHLNEIRCGTISIAATTNSLPSTLKHRSAPHCTISVVWGADLCFKVDGKLFVVAAMEMVPQRVSFKCTPENFAALCERPGIIPAPYMARAQWVSLE